MFVVPSVVADDLALVVPSGGDYDLYFVVPSGDVDLVLPSGYLDLVVPSGGLEVFPSETQLLVMFSAQFHLLWGVY